ncbi:hypothetical protein [Rhodococcus sp. NPDC003322]
MDINHFHQIINNIPGGFGPAPFPQPQPQPHPQPQPAPFFGS